MKSKKFKILGSLAVLAILIVLYLATEGLGNATGGDSTPSADSTQQQ